MPRQTLPETTAQIVTARTEHHAGPVRLAVILEIAASTIAAVLARAGVPRLADVDRLTGQLLRGRRHSDRRYECEQPGDLLHVDVKKLGRVPTAAAGGSTAAASRSADVAAAGTTCTSPSTITPGWHAPRCCPTSASPPAPAS
jgi:hypothetical protein